MGEENRGSGSSGRSDDKGLAPAPSLAEMLALMASGRFQEGLRALDRCFGRRLERQFIRLGMLEADAQEQTWTLLLKLYEQYCAGKSFTEPEFWAWATTVLRRQFIDWYRQQRRRPVEGPIDEPTEDGEGESLPGWLAVLKADELDSILLDCLQRAFVEFRKDYPERAQHLVWLVEEWSNEEIAEALSINRTVSLGSARDRIYQTRLKLRTYAAPCLDRS